MGRRVTEFSKVKEYSSVAIAKASPNRAFKLYSVDPKPSDLLMAKVNLD
jgi:predicted O-methyltransferase YrrM